MSLETTAEGIARVARRLSEVILAEYPTEHVLVPLGACLSVIGDVGTMLDDPAQVEALLLALAGVHGELAEHLDNLLQLEDAKEKGTVC